MFLSGTMVGGACAILFGFVYPLMQIVYPNAKYKLKI